MLGRKRMLFMWLLFTVAFYVIWILTYNWFTGSQNHFQLQTHDLVSRRSNYTQRNTTKDKNISCNVDDFVLDPAINQTDPCLVAFFKKKMLIPPRSPVFVKNIAFNRKEVDVPSNIEKLKWAVALLVEGAPKGAKFFFVDSGAHDGRFLSSTLRLETMFSWNGVLIEPQEKEFEELLKNREAWAVNAALCVTPHPEYIDFYKEGLSVMPGPIHQNLTKKISVKVPCVPLYTILIALNVTIVDYLSLDIEGAELLVLKTVPFDKVKFKIMAIEYNHLPGGDPVGQLEKFLKPKGYTLVAIISNMDRWTKDCLFVHNTVYQEKYDMIQYIIKNQKIINSVLYDDVQIKSKG